MRFGTQPPQEEYFCHVAKILQYFFALFIFALIILII